MGERNERKTLANYEGKSITITCTFEGTDDKRKVHHSLNEKTLEYEPTNTKKPDMIKPIIKINPEVPLSIIKDINTAAVITNIKGTDEYSDIDESHMFIQQNLRTCNPGDKVMINGIVRMYNDNKKKQGFDYYLDVIGYKPLKSE